MIRIVLVVGCILTLASNALADPASPPRLVCRPHVLVQGGSPTAPTVLVCEVVK